MAQSRLRIVRALSFALFTVSLLSCGRNPPDRSRITFRGTKALAVVRANDRDERARFINNPFSFTILKNISDNFESIGAVRKTWIDYPLQKENIADPAFCMIRTVEYDGMTVRVFSFDLIQGGTSEYLVHDDRVRLTNGLGVGSKKTEVVNKLGRPYKKEGDSWVWRSRDLHNYLVFTFVGDAVSAIRWHESRDVTYKDVRVWETRH